MFKKQHSVMKIVVTGVAFSMAMTSCKVIQQKYQAPEVAQVKSLYGDYSTIEDTTSVASIPWREYFNDPILQGLIAEALENNFDLQNAVLQIEQARQSLKAAKLAYFPSLSAGFFGNTYSRISSKDANGDVDYFGTEAKSLNFGLNATWEVELWGKLSAQKRSTLATYLSSQEGANLVKTSVISGVSTYYYTLLALDEQLRITKETVELLRETVAVNESLWKSGQVTAAAVEQSKSVLYSTELSIPSIEMSILQTENALSLLLGRQAGRIERSDFYRQQLPEHLHAGVPMQMLANRPDVRSAEYAYRSAFELTNVARASLYPSLSISQALVGFSATQFSQLFKPESLLLNVIGSFTMPIFAKGQLKANLETAKANQQVALNTFTKTVYAAGNEVANILFTFDASKRKNEFRRKQIESLEKSSEYTLLLLKAGNANYLEVISAQSNLLSAKLNGVSDRLEQLQAMINLYEALGGGIE